MTQPTAILAEDEQPQREELSAMLAEMWPELRIVAQCEDGLAALEALEQHRPDLAFLDIRMPGVSGLEVARAARPPCQVIFTTAYEEYALRAFDEAAVDYLLKPITRERLARSIERARGRAGGGNAIDIDALANLLQARLEPGRKPGIKWITASVGNSTRMFSIDEVLFFQAHDKYTRVVTADNEGHIRTPLKELLAALDAESFWQVHRSVIVRVAAIRTVDKDADGRLQLFLRGRQDVLPVSSAFQHRFRGM
jgi:DNA-binding LytR/AlgR family response regulator